MTTPACIKHETCSAPLCPLDAPSLANCFWYPDEEVCSKRGLPKWVLLQRKIARKCGVDAGFFTHPMLRQGFVVKGGLMGLNPEGYADELPQKEADWLRKHPPLRKLSESERSVYRERAQSLGLGQKNGLRRGISAPNS